MLAPARASTYVPHIDGLRAAAVLSVIVYHLNDRWLPGGFSGVDVFFAISGFVVSASIAELKGLTVPGFFSHFYARRIRRIVPALVVCLLVTAFLAMLFIPYAWISRTNERTGLYAFFGLSNFILAQTGNDYFSPNVDFNPYTHTWSLGVEEQFYLVFPPLFVAWMLGIFKRRASTLLFGAGALLSIVYAWRVGRSDPDFAFYMLSTRFWELAAGVLLYQWLAARGHAFGEHGRPATGVSTVCAIASAAVVVIGFVVSKPRTFPFPGALLPVIGTLGVIASLHGRDATNLVSRALGSRLPVFIGKISYSLYLWHWPVFVVFRWTTGLQSAMPMVAATALTFAFAYASYSFVEQPARYSPRLRGLAKPAVIACGLAIVGPGAWFASRISDAGTKLSLSIVKRNAADWYAGSSLPTSDDPACSLIQKVEPVGTSYAVVMMRANCLQPPATIPRMFAIGDSHASAYMTTFKTFALETSTEIHLYSNGGCPFLSLQPEREAGTCRAATDAAIADMLKQSSRGDVLFLPSLRLARFSNQFAAADEKAARATMIGSAATAARATAVKEAIARLEPFARKGVKIVFEAPKPIFRAPPFRCADWFDAMNPICAPGLTMSRSDIEAYRRPVMDAFAAISSEIPEVSVWDPLPTLCPSETCVVSDQGKPIYFDGDHLSDYGSRMLLPSFREFMARVTANRVLAASP